MPKKYHEIHRHRSRHSSKTRTHRKHKKEHVSQNPLEPIQEVSKEKVALIDQNTCGDHLTKQKKGDQVKKSKRSKEKNEQKIEKGKDKNNIFDKNYSQNLEKSVREKSARHHSLEKTEDSFLRRTKLLFRREKSFNDAVQKISDFKSEATEKPQQVRKHREHKHRSRRTKESSEDRNEYYKKSEKVVIAEKAEPIEAKPHSQDPSKSKRKKSHQRKHSSKDNKSPHSDRYNLNRVQEVIYCQMNQVPYKMKNDKNASEIKNLYSRFEKDERQHKDKEENMRHRSHSYGEDNQKCVEKHYRNGEHEYYRDRCVILND